MTYYPFSYKKTLSSVSIILVTFLSFGLLTYPKTTQAQWVVWDPGNNATAIAGWASMVPNTTANVVNTVKEQGLDAIGYIIAKAILSKISASTVNWINSGFEGNPTFLTDPERFFGNLGDQLASDYILGAGSPLNQLCSPFKAEVRLALVKNYMQEDSFKPQCTFEKIGTNFENFTKDFTQGGWDGWFALTQQSQNNPYGSYLNAKQQLSVQIGTQQNKYQTQVSNGNGFLSFEKCRADYVPPPPGGGECEVYGPDIPAMPGFEGSPAIPARKGACIKYKNGAGIVDSINKCPADQREVVTPGKVINDQLSNALGSGFKQLEAADELNEIINALMVQMVNKVVSSVGSGLRGLSSRSSTEPKSATEQLQNSINTSNEQLGLTATTTTSQALGAAVNTIPAQFQPGATPEIPSEAQIQAQVDQQTAKFRGEFPPASTTTP